MEFSIRVLVIVVLIVIAFVIFVALIAGWGGETNNMFKGLSEWFAKLLRGEINPPAGSDKDITKPTGASSGTGEVANPLGDLGIGGKAGKQ